VLFTYEYTVVVHSTTMDYPPAHTRMSMRVVGVGVALPIGNVALAVGQEQDFLSSSPGRGSSRLDCTDREARFSSVRRGRLSALY
jgi:hypothetical protein